MKPRKKLRRLFFLMYIFFLVGVGVAPVHTVAASSETEGSTEASVSEDEGVGLVGFAYHVQHPENQRDTGVGFFDLRMTPGQQQTVQIELVNGSDEERVVLIDLNGAKTNGAGVIEYSKVDIPNDASLKYDFVDVVSAPESITMAPRSTEMLNIDIQMPEASYDGMISGGIELKMQPDEEERAQQTGIINEYAYMIGMILTETDTVVEPELQLNSVSGGLDNFRNAVLINFSNIEANYLHNLTMDVQITPADSDTVLYDTKRADMAVAPNSVVTFPVSMNGERMEPGDYRAIILATAGDRSWSWEENFTITDEEADQFNEQDVNLLAEEGINWLLIAAIAGGVIVAGIIIFLIIHFVRKNKNQGEKPQSKSTKSKKKVRK